MQKEPKSLASSRGSHKPVGVRLATNLSLLVAIGYPYRITLCDWIELLIVPAVIAAGASGSIASNRSVSKRIIDSNKSAG